MKIVHSSSTEPTLKPQPTSWVKPNISFEQVMKTLKIRQAMRKPPGIYWSTGGLWWTHDPADLIHDAPFMKPPEEKKAFYEQAVKAKKKIVTDPAGHTLDGTTDWLSWMKQPITHPDQHGPHGIVAFMAAHAQNHAIFQEGFPRVYTSWLDFNEMLDKMTPEELELFKESAPLVL